MGKIIIDMPDNVDLRNYDIPYFILDAITNGTIISDNATNGDVVKAMFPDAEFDNAKPFTDGRWETMNLDTDNRTRATYKPTQLRTYADWWYSPYQKGVKECFDLEKHDKEISDKWLDKIKQAREEIQRYETDCLLLEDSQICQECNNNMFKSIYNILDKLTSESEG